MGVREAKFFDTTNDLAARTENQIAAKPLLVSTKFISSTLPKIQFCLLGAIFGSKFAIEHVESSICDRAMPFAVKPNSIMPNSYSLQASEGQ